jgi:putative ABC transport system permease protein
MTRWLDVLRLRVRSLFRRSAVDRELARELRFHLDEHVKELVAEGVSRAEAERRARVAFGSIDGAAEACRDERRVSLLTNFASDGRYAVRTIRQQPLLLLAATTSIALGAGANLAIFGLANSTFLSAPSSRDPDGLVHLRTNHGSHTPFSVWREMEASGTLAGLAGYRFQLDLNWRGRELSIPISALQVTANFFDVVGVPIAHGRGFSAIEAAVEREPRLVVISDRFWTGHLAGAPIIGQTLVLNGEPYTVIGITPPHLRSLPGYGLVPDVFLPITRSLVPDLDARRAGHVQLVGRLRPDQSVAAARAAMTVVVERIGVEFGDRENIQLRDLRSMRGLEQLREFKEVAAFFGVLLLVTALILSIACANVAGLLLARSAVRRREIALRLALGATRARVVQQLLTEGLVLSILGTAAALALTGALARLVPLIHLPIAIPVEFRLSFDARMMWLAVLLVVASTLLCALAPALQATRSPVMPAIKNESPAYVHRRFTARNVLVVSQVAVSALLLAMTMLFLRNLALAHTIAPEFDADRALIAQITFVEGRQGSRAAPAIDAIVERVASIPGVEAAAYSSELPLSIYTSTTGTQMRIEGRDAPMRVDYHDFSVSPGYLGALGIKLLRGRDFSLADDKQGSPLVVIVNEEFVRRYFAGHDGLGRHIYLPTDPEPTPALVVGVAANSKYQSIGEDRAAAVYTPYHRRARGNRFVHLIARTTDRPSAMTQQVRDVVLQMDPTAAVTAEPMTTTIAFAFLPSRLGAMLVGALGLLGALLAMVGLYGVVAFTVARRTSEIGIRLALGASPRAVSGLIVSDATALVGTGLAIGLVLAFFILQPLTAFLVATLPARDPVSFVATAALLFATSLLASWNPARRAMRIQPGVALRVE